MISVYARIWESNPPPLPRGQKVWFYILLSELLHTIGALTLLPQSIVIHSVFISTSVTQGAISLIMEESNIAISGCVYVFRRTP
jgi:hypothetical protein